MADFILSAFADEACEDFDGQLAALQEEGIHLIELRGVDGKSCADLTLEEADRLKKKLDEHGIQLSSLGSPYGKYPIEEPFAPHFAQFRHGLALCCRLGCTQMRMFSFFMPEGADTDQYKEEVVARLEQMLDEADKAGVRLMHENEKGIFGYNTENCAFLLERFGDRMGFIFDPANFVQCGVDTLQAFDRLQDRISYMHIKDALMADGAVVRAGCGDGNVEEILRRLNEERNGELLLTIEPHLTVFDGLGKLQQELVLHHEVFASQRAAFHAACEAVRGLLARVKED